MLRLSLFWKIALVFTSSLRVCVAQSPGDREMDSPAAPVFTSLLSFDSTHGAYPGGMSLIQGTDGDFYGVTGSGGTGSSCTYLYGCGTVFKVTPQGALTTLYDFCSLPSCADGKFPTTGVIQGTDGNFYGVTGAGGSSGYGTVFKLSPAGALSVLHSFSGSDSSNPGGMLIESNGRFYGTTYGSSSAVDYGTIFRITPTGTLTTLYRFCPQPGCADGKYPYAGLLQASDGNFYGTTSQGGASSACLATQSYGCGTIFKITPAGTLTTLHTFSGYPDDGNTPVANLIQANDSNLYGTTAQGGTYNEGVAFQLTLGGALTTFYSFCPQRTHQGSCLYGADPSDGIIQGTDGAFYGAALGGLNGTGITYRLTSRGTLTAMHNFSSADGANPYGGIIQGTDGTFYGNTQNGGIDGVGTIYNLNVGLAHFVRTQASFGKVGLSVVILGTNLTGATSVTFNGTAASFTVVSDSEITASVPTGATSGLVVVTTPGGTLKSSKPFRIVH